MAPRMTRNPSHDRPPDFAASSYRRQRSKLISDDNNSITNDIEAIEHLTEVWEERKSRRVATWEAQQLREAKKAGKQRQVDTAPPAPLSPSPQPQASSRSSSLSYVSVHSPPLNVTGNSASRNNRFSASSSRLENEPGGSGLGVGLESILIERKANHAGEALPSSLHAQRTSPAPPVTVRKAFGPQEPPPNASDHPNTPTLPQMSRTSIPNPPMTPPTVTLPACYGSSETIWRDMRKARRTEEQS